MVLKKIILYLGNNLMSLKKKKLTPDHFNPLFLLIREIRKSLHKIL